MAKQNEHLTVFVVSSFDVHKFQEFGYSNRVSMLYGKQKSTHSYAIK